MYRDHKIIAITPAGRSKHMKTLFSYIEREEIIDEYHLWVNTGRDVDLVYIKQLKTKKPEFVKLIYYYEDLIIPKPQPPFFKYCVEPGTIYLKFDDDICYIHEKAIKNLIDYRIDNSQYFLVIANIVNNGITAHIHQKNGAIKFEERMPCEFHNSLWKSPKLAEKVHKDFIADLINNDIEKYFFDTWTLDKYERMCINLIAWRGEDFAKFNGVIPGDDEELWLCCDKPRQMNQINAICGSSLVSHFSFYKQRQPFCGNQPDMDNRILAAYDFISKKGINVESINRILNSRVLL